MPSPRLPGSAGVADSLRLDKFLWFARIVKTRALAQQLAEQGRLRLGGRVIDRAHAPVRVGDVLSFAVRGNVRVLRVEALPTRRGPPAEARALYSEVVPADGTLTSRGAGD
ncbi:MAG TPA: RNA-binding S4 domain-containing protein [Allosphingosinicella sp.]